MALITGGTRGIGLGVARSLAGEGFRLALNGLRPAEQIAGTLAELRRSGADARYFRADIADGAARKRMVDEVVASFGRIDVLVNNAGAAPSVRADILDADETSFNRLIATNLRGPYFLTQAVARRMIEQREADPDFRGCVVFVTSISAEVASTNRGDYCISKAGLSMAARLWAVRLAEHGIGVYEVRPGIVATDMTAPVREKYDRLIEGGLLLDARWGRPEDVGRVVAMLARGDLAYSTGAVIPVDGGLMVPRL